MKRKVEDYTRSSCYFWIIFNLLRPLQRQIECADSVIEHAARHRPSFRFAGSVDWPRTPRSHFASLPQVIIIVPAVCCCRLSATRAHVIVFIRNAARNAKIATAVATMVNGWIFLMNLVASTTSKYTHINRYPPDGRPIRLFEDSAYPLR